MTWLRADDGGEVVLPGPFPAPLWCVAAPPAGGWWALCFLCGFRDHAEDPAMADTLLGIHLAADGHTGLLDAFTELWRGP